MSVNYYAAEYAPEEGKDGISGYMWNPTAAGLMRAFADEVLDMSPGTRVDFYTLEADATMDDDTAEGWIEAAIFHGDVKPDRSWTVPHELPPVDDGASEDERAAWLDLQRAREAVIQGDMWGHPHYEASRVHDLLTAVDVYAVERALRIVRAKPVAAPEPERPWTPPPAETWTLVERTDEEAGK